MKKIISAVGMALLLAVAAFAADDVSSGAFSLGISFPQIYNLNTADDAIDSEKYSAFGINFSIRGVVGLPFGLYADGNLYFPYAHKITIGNTEYSYDMGDGSLWGIEGQFGLYGVLLNTGRFLIPFGGGLHLNYGRTNVDGNPDVTQSTFSFGVGGWINAEFTLTEKVTLYGGIKLDYDFFQRLSTEHKTQFDTVTRTERQTEAGIASTLFVVPVLGVIFRF